MMPSVETTVGSSLVIQPVGLCDDLTMLLLTGSGVPISTSCC